MKTYTYVSHANQICLVFFNQFNEIQIKFKSFITHINRPTIILMGFVDKPIIWALHCMGLIKQGALLQLSKNCVFFSKLRNVHLQINTDGLQNRRQWRPPASSLGTQSRRRRTSSLAAPAGSPPSRTSPPEKDAVLVGDELGEAARSGFLVGGCWVAVWNWPRRLWLEGRRRPWVWMWSGSGAGRSLFSISASSRPFLRASSISGIMGLYLLWKDLIFCAFGAIFWGFLFIWNDGRTIGKKDSQRIQLLRRSLGDEGSVLSFNCASFVSQNAKFVFVVHTSCGLAFISILLIICSCF